MNLHGHRWTIGRHLTDLVRPPRAPVTAPWQAWVEDERFGRVALSGRVCHHPGSRAVAVIVHGLGGSSESGYCLRMAAACSSFGLSSLRLNLRGADRSGEDLYHGGLTADLRAALASPAVRRYPTVFLVGFSMGGHVSLRLAAEQPRSAAAVAAVCAPVDLAACCRHIDAGAVNSLYRRHLLGGLKEIYRSYAARRSLPMATRGIDAIRRIRDWDERIVAPRFGFAGADDYYRRASVAPLLGALAAPSLFVAAERDPMVPPQTVRPHLARASSALEVRWLGEGGHVGFPPGFALYHQIVAWLLQASGDQPARSA